MMANSKAWRQIARHGKQQDVVASSKTKQQGATTQQQGA
jgi:hypothetical protein